MMKGKVIAISVSVLLLICLAYYLGTLARGKDSMESNSNPVPAFEEKPWLWDESFLDYYIREYPSSFVLGATTNAEDAVKKALMIWVYEFGYDEAYNGNVLNVSIAENGEIWYVSGTLDEGIDGGTPEILIRKSDGKILAVWHSY